MTRAPEAVLEEMLRTRLVPNVSVTSVEMLVGRLAIRISIATIYSDYVAKYTYE